MSLKNVVVNGQEYSGIGEVNLQISGGGTARFIETSDADALASDISQGKKAYVKGNLVTGINSGGGGGGITPFFASATEEIQFTLDADVTTSYRVDHNLGVSPNIIEFLVPDGQTVSKQCITSGYICVLNPVPGQATNTKRDAYYYTPANGNTSEQTKINAGDVTYIGSGPYTTHVTIFGTPDYPLLAGLTYTVRLYVFK